MSTYQKIKERFQIDPTKRTYEEWIEIFKSAFNFSAGEIEKTIKVLEEEAFVFVSNHDLFVLDNKNYALGTIAVVRANFGFVENDPVTVTQIKLGDSVKVDFDKISDWMYYDKNVVKGAFTVRVMRANMSEAELNEMDAGGIIYE